MGWPATIRSDGGPQFLGPFNRWCSENSINPYNPRENGLAEAAVKNVKTLLAKCAETKNDAQKALYHWRNIPRSDGFSPAQLLFGRKQFTALPAEDSHYTTQQQHKSKKIVHSCKQETIMMPIKHSCSHWRSEIRLHCKTHTHCSGQSMGKFWKPGQIACHTKWQLATRLKCACAAC